MGNEALLAPVPEDLLQDALDKGYTLVAFGSMARDFFGWPTDDGDDDRLAVLLCGAHPTEFWLEAKCSATISDLSRFSKAELSWFARLAATSGSGAARRSTTA